MKIELTLANGLETLESFEFDTAGECNEQVREAIYQAFVRGLAVELDYDYGLFGYFCEKLICSYSGA